MLKKIIYLLLLSVCLKFAYFGFAYVVSTFDKEYKEVDNFTSLFKRNDSYWYQKAADEGYPKITNPLDLGYSYGKYYKQSVWAHFPAYPLSIRATEHLTGFDFNQSAFVVSLIFTATSFVGFFLLCLSIFKLNEKQSFLYTLFFALFPFHYYYSMYYTEAMFFTFLAFSFYAINKKLYWLAAITTALLALTRPNGIVCLLPLFIYYIELEIGLKNILSRNFISKKLVLNALLFLAAPLALAMYCMYQKQMTGFYFAFVKAQAGWYKEFMFPLLALFRSGDVPTQFNSVYTIVFMILSIIAWRKLPLSMNVFIWINILLPMASGSVACMPRYISAIFPLTIYLLSFIADSKFRYPALALAFALQLLTFYPWLINSPFSF